MKQDGYTFNAIGFYLNAGYGECGYENEKEEENKLCNLGSLASTF